MRERSPSGAPSSSAPGMLESRARLAGGGRRRMKKGREDQERPMKGKRGGFRGRTTGVVMGANGDQNRS